MRNFKLFIGVFTVLISLVTTVFIENNRNNEKDITILNIEALNASAGEAWCDKSTDDICEIEVTPPDGGTPIIGSSKGLYRFSI
ncbi:MAG: hypothetical protein R3Y26_00855 [Rikenellaceae bacterium]